MAESALGPGFDVIKVNYFTAAIKSKPWDPGKRTRQYVYWRALRTVPNLEIIEGHYQEPKRYMFKVEPSLLRKFKNHLCRWDSLRNLMQPPMVQIIKAEEKRSDVNLATQMLVDACDNAFDCAAVVSNDSDLLAPISQVRKKFKKKVSLICFRDKPSKDLNGHVDFYRYLNPPMLSGALFPQTLVDATGEFHKPQSW